MCGTNLDAIEQTNSVKEVRTRTYELVEFLHDILRSIHFPGPVSRIGSACTTVAAPCGGSSTRGRPGVRIKEIAHAIVSAASDKASTSSLSTAAGRRADTNTGPALGARRQGYYSPVCENLRHSRGLGRRAPVSEETRRVQNLRLAPEASETAGGIAGPEPGAGRARVTVWRFFSSVIVRKSTERKNQPEIASPTWRRTRVFVAGSKTTATFWILAIAVPTSVRSGRSDSADQCPGQAHERSFGTGLRLGLRRNKQNCRRDHCLTLVV